MRAVPGRSAEDAAEAAEEVFERRRRIDRSRIEMMRGYAETPGCRRQYLLGYFGEQLDTPCGHCDGCERLDNEPGASDAGRSHAAPRPGRRGRTSRTSVCSTRIGVRAR